MSDDAEVAAVLAEALGATTTAMLGGEPLTAVYRPEGLAHIALAALTKAGYAVVKLDDIDRLHPPRGGGGTWDTYRAGWHDCVAVFRLLIGANADA